MNEAVIASACRTAIGSFRGSLSALPATALGSVVIREALQRAGIASDRVDEVIMGNVLQAGEGQAPARQAALGAGLPDSVQCLTVNKVCGSGLKSVMLAAQAVMAGDSEIIVAGGMESMSNVPYLLPKAREGYRMGNGEIVDGMMFDGLTDAYKRVPMGVAADKTAVDLGITRAQQDEFAILSYRRAQESQLRGRFQKEIVGVEIPGGKSGPTTVVLDEDVQKTNFEKIPQLKPVFSKDGSVTAANSSKISDGAAAVVVTSERVSDQLGLKPLARIIAQATYARAPMEFTIAPADAITKVLVKAGMTLAQIDLFEINEAFAVVTLAVSQQLGIDIEKINVNGGAVAMGHPIGASGARVLVTLLHAMEQRDAKRGLATLCIGGGEASAVIVERM
jgi:acetyl-CoA C-acetyltransferase